MQKRRFGELVKGLGVEKEGTPSVIDVHVCRYTEELFVFSNCMKKDPPPCPTNVVFVVAALGPRALQLDKREDVIFCSILKV